MIYSHRADEVIKQEPRPLKEPGCDVFIRNAEGVSIFNKVNKFKEDTFDALVSSRRPFGIDNLDGEQKGLSQDTIAFYKRGEVVRTSRREILKNRDWIDKPKILISRGYGAGNDFPHQIIGKPIVVSEPAACSETYIVIGPFSSVRECQNVVSYISTKFFRFLVMLRKISQDATSSVYAAVPLQDFGKPWTDDELYAKYGITDEEIAFIESMIRPMDLGDSDA